MPTLMESVWDIVRTIGAGNSILAAYYPLRKAWAEARWEDTVRPRRGLDLWHAFRRRLRRTEPPWPKRWTSPGQVRYVHLDERGATLAADHGTIEVAFFALDLVRVRVLPHREQRPPEPVPYAIAKPPEAWPTPPIVAIQNEEALLLQTESLTVGVSLDTGQIFFADAERNLLRADVESAWGDEGAVRHRTALFPEEQIFGLGERTTPANRRGGRHVLWNADPAGYEPGDDPININIPAYVGMHERGSYLVFYENPFYGRFDLGAEVENLAEHRFTGGELRYYFAAGPVPTLLERYTELTGRHDLPPLWMLGYQQSRWSYATEERVRKLARDFRQHEVPCDAIHLDIDYMDAFKVFTWNEDRFPDLPQLADDLREMGIKLVTIIDPGIKQDLDYDVYLSGLLGDHFCALPNGEIFHGPVWPGISAYPDFTDPDARTWWGKQYRPLVEAGIAGFWNDMNEPSVFSNGPERTLPDPTYHTLEGRGGDHREAHNLYGVQTARASREGLLRLRPDHRPVVITRAGWAGVQRYATSWTGDNASTWASLRLTVPMMLGLGLSGLAFTGSDIGGFQGAADGELYTRWVQMGAFMPFFRAHTVIHTPDQEPWAYGEPYLSIVRRFIQLRYELLPYLYTATWQMATRGWPMVRPIWWHTEDQGNAALWDVEDSFLCGDALLIAPVGEAGKEERAVQLPSGIWYDYWTNQPHAGNEIVAGFAPLELIPIFVREGSILTLGEYGPSVEQRKQKFLRLGLYPLTEEGERTSLLYEDAGEGFGYREGEYRVNRFVVRRTPDRLVVTWEREGNYAPPYEHVELSIHGLVRVPPAIVVDGDEYAPLVKDAVRRMVLLGVPPFEKLEILL